MADQTARLSAQEHRLELQLCADLPHVDCIELKGKSLSMQFSRLFEHAEDELEPIGIIVSCSWVGNRGGWKVINDFVGVLYPGKFFTPRCGMPSTNTA